MLFLNYIWKEKKYQHFQIPIRTDAGPPWKALSCEWSFLSKYHNIIVIIIVIILLESIGRDILWMHFFGSKSWE